VVSIKELTFRGFRIQYNDPHDIAAIIESYVLNVYRIQKIKRGSIVLDIGAGIGEFAVLASDKVGKEGKVIAIEPSPDDFKTLQDNIRLNGCNNVIPINSAVSDKKERLLLKFKEKEFEAKGETLSEILSNLGIAVNSVNYMKMDMEGGERSVIPSSIDIIRRIDYLAIEIHDGFSSELIPYMSNLGFRFDRIERKKYLLNAIRHTIIHPVGIYKMWQAFTSTGENPGFGKISSGIDISKSKELVVGLFYKSKL
jgi:SAM-dependent methyltransferase